VKTGTQAAKVYFIFTDRQGSVSNIRQSDGTWVNNSTVRYDAFGGYRSKPADTVNPGISDRGYTGHRMNNTGTNDLGLIYMNARYYLPEVGRFISADSVVPEPGNPQSYNRYSYVRNNPMNFTDPTGHAESSGCEYEGCTLPDGFAASTTWQTADEVLVHWDPNLAAAQDYNPITEAVLPGGAMIIGIATVSVIAEGILGVLSWPTLASGGSAACADGDCGNEVQAIQAGAHTVYRYVEGGVTKYVGISNNFARRAAEHFTQREWNIERIPGLGNLSKSDARAVEQVLIEHYGLENLYNKINSIAASNSIYQEALQRGLEILNHAGIFPWRGP